MDGFSVGVFYEGIRKDKSYGRKSLEAFAAGVSRSADRLKSVRRLRYSDCDVAVIFGECCRGGSRDRRRRMKLKAEIRGRHLGHSLVVLDTPLLLRQSKYGANFRRIGLDSSRPHIGTFPDPSVVGNRADKLLRLGGLELHDWRLAGDYVLVVLQRPWDASLPFPETIRPSQYLKWIIDTVVSLAENIDLPIRVRPHPGSLSVPSEHDWLRQLRRRFAKSKRVQWGDPNSPIGREFDRSALHVSFSSTSSVEAAIHGVPVMTGGEANFAWPVSIGSIADLNMENLKDRSSWLQVLAAAEWSLEEIESGRPWQFLRSQMSLS